MKLDGKTILFQGDSITDMARGRNDWDQNHLYGHSYVFLLASKFGYEAPEKHIRFYNRGVSGDRCVDVQARWKEDALALKPDVISLLVGINDIVVDVESGNGVSAEKYAEVLGEIIEETRQALPEVRFVLCEPFFFTAPAKEIYREVFSRRVPEHQRAAREVAQKYGCLFVPLQEDFDKACQAHPSLGEGYWLWDGVHPTAPGHLIIAKKWLACVEADEDA